MQFGTPLSEQAKAELNEATGQVNEALTALAKGLLPTEGNLLAKAILETARNQCQQAIISLAYIRDMDSGNNYYRKEAELGVHRVMRLGHTR